MKAYGVVMKTQLSIFSNVAKSLSKWQHRRGGISVMYLNIENGKIKLISGNINNGVINEIISRKSAYQWQWRKQRISVAKSNGWRKKMASASMKASGIENIETQ
jgi:hypothetical protein